MQAHTPEDTHVIYSTCTAFVATVSPLLHRLEPIIGINGISRERRALLCNVCGQPYGACVQCAHAKCFVAFHATCAREAHYTMVSLVDKDVSDNDDDDDNNAENGPGCEEDGAAGSCGTAPDVLHSDQQQKQQTASTADAKLGNDRPSRSSKRGRRRTRKEGTVAGDTRLCCFCPRHAAGAAAVGGVAIFSQRPACSLPLLSAASGASSQLHVMSGGGASRCVANVGDEVTSPNRRIGSGMADAVLHDEIAPGVPALPGCARSRRADGAARRGLRAPDALAAALRKRLYVRATPYLVGSCTCAGQMLPPPARRDRSSGPEFSSNSPSEAISTANGPGLVDAQLQTVSGNNSDAAGVPQHVSLQPALLPARPNGVLSLAQRFARMRATLCDRLCAGKSSIHGLGVFAKRHHRAGACCSLLFLAAQRPQLPSFCTCALTGNAFPYYTLLDLPVAAGWGHFRRV